MVSSSIVAIPSQISFHIDPPKDFTLQLLMPSFLVGAMFFQLLLVERVS
jgi:hypothetical protein